MSSADAKRHLDREPGEGLVGYITPDDVKDAIDQIYTDMPAGGGGGSATLGGLTDVDDSAATAPAGQFLGTTATGQWGPVPAPPGGGGTGASPSDANPVLVSLSGTQSPGTSADYSRADHRHVAYTSAPVALGAAAAMGSSSNFSRADHVHPYPTAAQVGAVTQAEGDARWLAASATARVLVLAAGAQVPGGTPAGTVIVRTG